MASERDSDGLLCAIVCRLAAEDVAVLNEENVRAALAPCVGGPRLVEAGVSFLNDGSLAEAIKECRLASAEGRRPRRPLTGARAWATLASVAEAVRESGGGK